MSLLRTSGLILAALAVALATSATASAQQRGGRGGFGGGRMVRGADTIFILVVEPVQKELKLNDDQLDVVEDAVDMWNEQSRQIFGNMRDLSQEERRAKMEEARPAAEKKAKELISKIEGKLDDSQKKRLHELVLQQRGAFGALQDPDLQTALSMTDEQKKKIETLAEESRGGFGQGGQGGRGQGANEEDRQARFEAMRKAREERNKKALDVLTSGQQSEFEKMQGEKFEFPAFNGGRGRGNAG